MTLISHKYKFIFIRPMKVASTSVEYFFRKYCMNIEDQKKYKNNMEMDNEIINKYGIVSMQGCWNEFKKKNMRWSQHLGSEIIRKYLIEMNLEDCWDNYFKFTIVRNPWDMIISRYFQSNNKNEDIEITKKNLLNFIKINELPPQTAGTVEKIITLNISENLWIITIDKKLICDFHIRYENLKEDIEKVCNKIGITNYNLLDLKNFRSNTRKQNNKNYRKYYTEETKNLISEIYKDYINYFSYEF